MKPEEVWRYIHAERSALADTLDVDIFAPPRQDWLDKTDAYLRDT